MRLFVPIAILGGARHRPLQPQTLCRKKWGRLTTGNTMVAKVVGLRDVTFPKSIRQTLPSDTQLVFPVLRPLSASTFCSYCYLNSLLERRRRTIGDIESKTSKLIVYGTGILYSYSATAANTDTVMKARGITAAAPAKANRHLLCIKAKTPPTTANTPRPKRTEKCRKKNGGQYSHGVSVAAIRIYKDINIQKPASISNIPATISFQFLLKFLLPPANPRELRLTLHQALWWHCHYRHRGRCHKSQPKYHLNTCYFSNSFLDNTVRTTAAIPGSTKIADAKYKRIEVATEPTIARGHFVLNIW